MIILAALHSQGKYNESARRARRLHVAKKRKAQLLGATAVHVKPPRQRMRCRMALKRAVAAVTRLVQLVQDAPEAAGCGVSALDDIIADTSKQQADPTHPLCEASLQDSLAPTERVLYLELKRRTRFSQLQVESNTVFASLLRCNQVRTNSSNTLAQHTKCVLIPIYCCHSAFRRLEDPPRPRLRSCTSLRSASCAQRRIRTVRLIAYRAATDITAVSNSTLQKTRQSCR